ncbi:hypothetical protein NC653_027486, partial [Populus alba x Populus x berolinensis]
PVEALTQIGKTVKEDGQPSLKFVGRCQSGRVVETEPTSAGNSTIECNCSITDDNYCHITSFQLEDYDLPGRLPPELANLTYVQNIELTRNYLYGTIPVEWASMKNLSSISLTANRLSGNIPAHLGSFTALTYLSVESNQFSGVVPPELGKLVNLKTLILSGNKLVGTLPEALAQIKDLKDFRASDNNLNGTVPEFIGNWTQLQKLELYATGLQGPIPPAIFHLEKLSHLRIADMPGPEFQLPNVTIKRVTLVLRNINLTGTIPENAWKVETTLFLSGNKLTGTVLTSFLENSQILDVSYNNFSRSPRCSSSNESDLLPCSEISRCPKYYRSFHINCGGPDVKNGKILYEGYRTYCEEPEEASKKPIVIGVVTSAAFLILLVMGVIYWKLYYGDKHTRERVTALKQIGETLTLGGQPFEVGDACNQSGTLHDMNLSEQDSEANSTLVCNCTLNLNNDSYCHITSLYLKTLSLPGKLPPEIANLTYLEILDLTRNYISGNIPEEWASMKHLTNLSLTSNRLSGNIPGYLGSFRSLTYLSLEANQFSGTIPSQLGDLVNLTDLILSSNQLEGTLPKTLAKLNLTHFRASDNNLSGRIPDFIGKYWRNLVRLELYASGLQGPIPPAILSLENLTDLRITDMSGPESNLSTIPPRVNYLVLRNINLTGVIPTDVWTTDSLKMLDLTFNKMEGRIPQDAKTREFMFLSGNKLNGSVPDSFFKTDKKIDVSYNNFSLPPSCQDHQGSKHVQEFIHQE